MKKFFSPNYLMQLTDKNLPELQTFSLIISQDFDLNLY